MHLDGVLGSAVSQGKSEIIVAYCFWMELYLMKLSTSKWLILFGALCCHASFASENITPATANVFQVAMSDPNDVVGAHCPQIRRRHNPYIIHSQQGIDRFAKFRKCHKVPFLSISGKNITNFKGLRYITQITNGGRNSGSAIYIGPLSRGKGSYSNINLKRLIGLNKLTRVNGTIFLNQNNALTMVRAFNNVKVMNGSISILFNPALKKVSMFRNKLERLRGQLNILLNVKTASFLDSFKHLKRVDTDLHLESSNTPRFSSLNRINGSLYIGNTDMSHFLRYQFKHLSYVGQQIGIYNNLNLTSLNGLQYIKHFGGRNKGTVENLIYFVNNPKLVDCSELAHLYEPSQKDRYSFDEATPASCKVTLEQ